MTMHLIRGMSTINTKKRKRKKTPGESKSIEKHDRWLRAMGVHPDQLKGKTKDAGNKIPDYAASRSKLKTSDVVTPVQGKREANVYTGTLIKGIGTMHKSNMVPITSNESAKEIATMRRN